MERETKEKEEEKNDKGNIPAVRQILQFCLQIFSFQLVLFFILLLISLCLLPLFIFSSSRLISLLLLSFTLSFIRSPLFLLSLISRLSDKQSSNYMQIELSSIKKERKKSYHYLEKYLHYFSKLKSNQQYVFRWQLQ